MASEAWRGFVAGLWGVLGMAGAGFTTRRLVEPSARVGKTHYESVVEFAHGLAAPDAGPLTAHTRVRLGELAHYGFGGFWGVLIALGTRRSTLHPVAQGTRFGTAIWLLAFAGYMPALGISRPLWQMKPHEFMRTLVSHLAFSITTFAALKVIRDD